MTTIHSTAAPILCKMDARPPRPPGGHVWALLELLGKVIRLAFAWSSLARSSSLGTSIPLFICTVFLTHQMIPTGIICNGFYSIHPPQYTAPVFIGLWILIPMVAGLLLLRRFHRDPPNR